MKLYNTVVVWDIYVLAESNQAAREAAMSMIQGADQLQPSESTAIEVRKENEIRDAWRQESPIVGADIGDADFAKVKGKKVIDVYHMLHTKPKNGNAAADAK